MSQEHDAPIDSHTGTPTTGHEWDGLTELNTPLPRWWLWTFYATIIWAFGYWVVYPAWPLIFGATEGVTGWHARSAVVQDLASLDSLRGPMTAKLASAPLAEIEKTPELLSFARAQGGAAFATNCAPCHGAGGQGAKGYPNLNDDDWLWGGKLEDIEQTITHGIRWDLDAATRNSLMPAFGRDGLLKPDEVRAVADYTRSLSGLAVEKGADLAKGKELFAANCAACHGPDGKGNAEVGAPNLADPIWLNGSDRDAVIARINNGGGGVMPAWGTKLDPTTIKALAVYVHTLGGGK
jgi:cytochrome c oxidase cbb3-type subunit III